MPLVGHVLRSHSIAYTYWYEYALRHLGSKTIVFSLYLLVHSVEQANECLRSAGWAEATAPEYSPQYYDPDVDKQVVLGHPDHADTLIVLLQAHSWSGVKLSSSAEDEDHYPSLPELYNALAQRFLDTSCTPFRKYLNLQLGYLYEDCAEVSSPAFVTTLPPDIRQFHLDWLSGTLRMHTRNTVEHERAIRERARRGDWLLIREGTASMGGTKIDREYEAKLAATLPAVAT